ncbi:beta-lactamase family protein [Kordiimonas sp. SCSIO 12603]|uniref:serine hydrolase domain-containing protein n=1 Tax=Kordiimonas sp. SCSIO 12603 TaxID=2829596 RepID=UPI002105C719|nr:serine hydrolase domain-containing protein [Kordiimonas sp. SCSIO 12603]UTW59279.1 beta-lactamase family protein [Kordiimonas sp. SCSIO 12603]
MFKILASVLALGFTEATVADEQEVQKFENALAPTFQLKGRLQTFNMLERMQLYDVPAVSVAIIDDGKIAWSHAWGVSDTTSGKQATEHTLFQAASISKPVSAFAVMQMVDKGELRLDTPINDYLKSWQLPENELSEKTPVTLKHLLSHTAGTTVHGFPGYQLGAEYPSTKDVVAGAGTANTGAVIVDFEPGTNWRYSGGGYTVMQLALEDRAGVWFPEIVNKLTVKPAGMNESFFDFIVPENKKALLASGHLPNGEIVKDGYVVHPESAAASLWTTPNDIATFSLEMMKAWNGVEGALITQKSAKEMLTHIKGGYGLGFSLEMEGDEIIGFKHGGSNVGFRAYMITLLEGKGAVVMTNSDNGMKIIEEILSAAANTYHWPIYQSAVKDWRPATAEERNRFTGSYAFEFQGREIRFNVTAEGEGFLVESQGNLSPTQFFIEGHEKGETYLFAQMGMEFSFSKNEAGELVMKVWGNQAKRLPAQ